MEPSKVIVAAQALMDTARQEADASFATTPERERLRRIARKICLANSYYPDDVVMGLEGQAAMFGPKRAVCIVGPIRPQWMLYLSEAEQTIRLIDQGENALPVEDAAERDEHVARSRAA